MRTSLCLMSVNGTELAGPGELGVIERDAENLPVLIRAAIEGKTQIAVDNGLKLILPAGGAADVVRHWTQRNQLRLPIDINHGTHRAEGMRSGAVGYMHPEAAGNELHFRVQHWEVLGKTALTGLKPNGEGAERFIYSSPTWVPKARDNQGRFVIGGVAAMALTNTPRTLGIKALVPLQMAEAGGSTMEVSFNIPDDVAAKLPEGGVIAGLFGAMMLYAVGDELYGVGAEGEPVKMGPMGGEVADMAEKGAVLAMSQKLATLERENAAVAKASALMASQLKALNAEKAERDMVAMSARVNDLALRDVPQSEILAFHERLKKGDDISVEVKAFERLPKRSTDAAPSVSNPGPALPTKEAYAAMSEQEKGVFLAGGVASVRHLQAIGALPSFGK